MTPLTMTTIFGEQNPDAPPPPSLTINSTTNAATPGPTAMNTATGTTPATGKKTLSAMPITTSDSDSTITCPYCERTSKSRNGLVGRLQIYHTETSQPVSGAPTYTCGTLLN
ncbi:hypothetical protein SprV_0100079600 [Sparganum proliferum]